jgi:tripartite-type tricarboxylate transporter receptor subunit TctC
MTCKRVVVAAGFAALLASELPAVAQTYPSKPVKVVVSHAAGSSPDVVARLVTTSLGQRLDQTFVVENKVGANGSLAVEMVSRAPADGYTLLVAGSSIMASTSIRRPVRRS